jgi:hypothetical protein
MGLGPDFRNTWITDVNELISRANDHSQAIRHPCTAWLETTPSLPFEKDNMRSVARGAGN